MSKCKLSIHTATYNRGYIIENAYRSLQTQTCYDFEWVVTDDGSTDNTEELFRRWTSEEKKFPIIYNKKEKGGIPRALNYGVNAVNGDYFFMLDSDDYVLPNAVEKLNAWIREIDTIDDIVAVGVARSYPDGEYIKGVPPLVDEKTGYIDANNIDRKYYNLDADMSEAYKVNIMKKYPFPVWETEIYAPEQLCFNAMALDGYKVRWHKDILYICDYLQDGQTKGNWNLFRRNPMGYAMACNQILKYEKGFLKRFKTAAQHIALSIVGKNYQYIRKSNALWLSFFTLPYGIALAMRRKNQFRYDDPVNRK